MYRLTGKPVNAATSTPAREELGLWDAHTHT
jgi:hypothetical protein